MQWRTIENTLVLCPTNNWTYEFDPSIIGYAPIKPAVSAIP